MITEPLFLPAASGQRFCLLYSPDVSGHVRGAVVYVHPFAEEMNKSRRMVAIQARAMAEEGYVVLQMDLYGCGDSSGDFGDASWSDWVEDVVFACAWLRQKTNAALWLWGLRAGCLLISEAMQQIDPVEGLLFWQPVLSGKQFWQQFVRLKIAGEILSGESKGFMEQMRYDLAQGLCVEIAGYTLSPELIRGLESAEMTLPDTKTRVEWMELSSKPEGSPSPAAKTRLDKWSTQGHALRWASVPGPAFWQTTEIEECPDLISNSLAAMESEVAR